ncbi:hypothetical protein ACTXT7_015646 [Hymenolepis weldensis]
MNSATSFFKKISSITVNPVSDLEIQKHPIREELYLASLEINMEQFGGIKKGKQEQNEHSSFQRKDTW